MHHHIEIEGGWKPIQVAKPRQITFSPREKDIINAEITKLLNTGVVEWTYPLNGDFLSTVFVRPEKMGVTD